MTSIESYKEFQLKVNNLANSDNVDISPGEFVMLFNEQQVKWYQQSFKNRSSRFIIDEVELLAFTDKPLVKVDSTDRYDDFELPSDYLDFIRAYCQANKNECSKNIRTYQSPLTSLELNLRDSSNCPSFEYAETPLTISSDRLQVYKTDFSITSTFLTYYRYPLLIDIEGYKRIDGNMSTNIDPELDKSRVDEIIDMCVLEVKRIFTDAEGYQLSADRVNKNNQI